MAEYPTDLKYAETHEWARREDDGLVTVGISDFAQESLGDIVYVELPDLGTTVGQAEEAGVIESVKAASDLYAPVGGEVVAINEELEDAPEIVNDSPYGSGWLFKLRPDDSDTPGHLKDATSYQEQCDAESH